MGVDQMGTMFARREGAEPDLDPVYVGSHLDTQPTGGRYDGVLGVLSGLELVRTLNDLGIRTRRPIVIVNWTNEEGARFAPAMLASGVFAGVHALDYAYGRKDPEGKTFGDELKRIGWVGDEPVGARKMHAYFEYHIEQGPILEAEGKEIGVVTHGQGLWWLEFTLTGKEAHTGSTPMTMRVNAGLAMARILEMVQKVAMERPARRRRRRRPDVLLAEFAQRPSRQGRLHRRHPLARAEEARRHARRDRGRGAEDLRRARRRLLDRAGRPFRSGDLRSRRSSTASATSAERLGYSHMNIISGAGHDACWMARVAPSTMVMCPCVDGLSHNEAENISKEWATAGADVLFHAVVETAEMVE